MRNQGSTHRCNSSSSPALVQTFFSGQAALSASSVHDTELSVRLSEQEKRCAFPMQSNSNCVDCCISVEHTFLVCEHFRLCREFLFVSVVQILVAVEVNFLDLLKTDYCSPGMTFSSFSKAKKKLMPHV